MTQTTHSLSCWHALRLASRHPGDFTGRLTQRYCIILPVLQSPEITTWLLRLVNPHSQQYSLHNAQFPPPGNIVGKFPYQGVNAHCFYTLQIADESSPTSTGKVGGWDDVIHLVKYRLSDQIKKTTS